MSHEKSFRASQRLRIDKVIVGWRSLERPVQTHISGHASDTIDGNMVTDTRLDGKAKVALLLAQQPAAHQRVVVKCVIIFSQRLEGIQKGPTVGAHYSVKVAAMKIELGGAGRRCFPDEPDGSAAGIAMGRLAEFHSRTGCALRG